MSSAVMTASKVTPSLALVRAKLSLSTLDRMTSL